MAKWQSGKVANSQYSMLKNDKMASWQNGKWTKQQVDKMAN